MDKKVYLLKTLARVSKLLRLNVHFSLIGFLKDTEILPLSWLKLTSGSSEGPKFICLLNLFFSL